VVTIGQIGIGLYQARNGLPELFVGIHMVMAAVLVAIAVSVLVAQRVEPARAQLVGQRQPQ
jgi:cytochrome c oxidase assembly protein subunit 15